MSRRLPFSPFIYCNIYILDTIFVSSLHLFSKTLNLSIQVYNLHRSPYFWDHPNEFEPERFLVQKKSEDVEGWDGFDPSRSPGALYPNEVIYSSLHLSVDLFIF